MKALAKILLLLIVLQAGGFLFLSHFIHASHQNVVLNEKKKSIHYSFSKEEFSKLKKEGEKEFYFGNTWFDIKKITIVKDRVEIEAIADKYEVELNKLFDSNEKSEQQTSKNLLFKSLDATYLTTKKDELKLIVKVVNSPELTLFLKKIYSEVVSPPPEMV